MEKGWEESLVIIPKPDYISWEEITKLLHLGYSERADEGLNYSATHQSVEKTIARVGDGVCLVALLDGKLIGTESYNLIKRKNLKLKRWYQDEEYYYLHSLTVHPYYKRKGIGLKIRNYIRDEAIKNGVGSLISDTSVDAKWLISWYNRLGHKKVGYVSHSGTNYYSVVMRTPIRGKVYSDSYRKLRFFLSYLFCRLLLKKNGDWRLIGKIAERIYRILFLKNK